MPQIPIYSPDGGLLRFDDEERICQHAQHFRLVRNKRKHLKRAYLKPSLSLDTRPQSSYGVAFEQELPTGHVWALSGVRGSR